MINKNKLLARILSLPRLSLVAVLIASGLLLTLVNWSTPPKAQAATSANLNFQARLLQANGAVVPDGNYHVEFKVFNASTSSGSSQGSCTSDANCLWTETRTTGNLVRVVNGYLTVNLGSVTSFPAINWDQDLWLTMNIGGTAGSATWDGEMSPRLKLTAVPYAFRAGQLAKLTSGNTSTLGFATQTAARSLLLPDEGGTLCVQSSTNCGFALTSGLSNYVQFAPATVQADSSTNNSIFINKTGASGSLLKLQKNGSDIFDVGNTGNITASGTYNTNTFTSSSLIFGASSTASIASAASQALNITGNAASTISTTAGTLTLQGGSGTVSLGSSTNLTAAGALTVSSGGTNTGLTLNSAGTGSITMDAGANPGTIDIGATNAGAVNIGRSGTTTTVNSSTFRALGRNLSLSNFFTEYRWRYGNSTDLNWKTVANVTIGTGTFEGISYQADILDSKASYGQTADELPMRYYVSIIRSGAVQDDVDAATLAGPVADYIRVVKTATGVYEVQVRQIANNRSTQVTLSVTSGSAGTVNTYATSPANGSTGGTVYLPSTTGYTHNFANLNAAGNLQVGGTTVITQAQVLQNVTANTSILTAGTLGIARGGTNNTTYTSNGVVYYDGTKLASTAAGSNGQCLLTTAGVPAWGTCTAGATPTLQQAYTASTNPEIVVDATRGGLTIRDASSAIGANLLEIQNNAGSTTYLGLTASALNIGVATNMTDTLSIQPPTDVRSLVMQASSGQTNDVMQVLASDNSVKAGISANGSLYTANRLTVGQASVNTSGTMTVLPLTNSTRGLVVQGLSGQTGDLLGMQDNSGNVLLRVDSAGVLGTSVTNSASTNSRSVTMRSGNATGTTSNSGDITIDSGTATGTAGTINIGATNASGVTIGRSGTNSNVAGNLQVGGTTVITSGQVLQNVTANTSILTAGTLGIARGGTNNTTYTSSGVVYYDGTKLASTAAGSNGQCLLTTAGVPAWGTCTAGATPTLQQAYNASTSPELVVDATRGGLTLRDAASPIGGNLLELQNNAGSTTYLGLTASALNIGVATSLTNTLSIQPATDSTSVVNVKTSINNNVFTVDTTNGRVGISLSGSNLPSTVLDVGGSLRLTLPGPGDVGVKDKFISPGAADINTAINIPLYEMTDIEQGISLGIISTSDTSVAAIGAFDARTVAHRPTIGVFSPDEGDMMGFSWEGSNTVGRIKTLNGSIALAPDEVTRATLDTSGNLGFSQASTINALQIGSNATGYALTLQGGTGGSGNNIGGNLVLRGGAATGSGTDGAVVVKPQTSSTTTPSFQVQNSSGTAVMSVLGAGATTFQNSTNGTAAFRILSSGGGSLFNVDTTNTKIGLGTTGEYKELGNNFGSTLEAGALMSKNSYFGEEWSRFRTGIVDAGITAVTLWGDNTGWTFSEQTNTTNDCNTATSTSLLNGVSRLSNTDASTGCLLFLSGGSGTTNTLNMFNATNLPVIMLKARLSAAGANDNAWIGIGDSNATSTTDPNNGIYFTNNATNGWVGVTRSASTSTAVTCTGQTVSTTVFAALKIEVISTSLVNFYVDNDVSNGVSWTLCGSSTTNIPTSALTAIVKSYSTSSGFTVDTDYFRVWQDDVAANNGADLQNSTGTAASEILQQSKNIDVSETTGNKSQKQTKAKAEATPATLQAVDLANPDLDSLNVSGPAKVGSLVVDTKITSKSLEVTGLAKLDSLTVTNAIATDKLEVKDLLATKKLQVEDTVSLGGDLKFTTLINTKQSANLRLFKASQAITPGSVVVLDAHKDGYVTLTNTSADTRIIGVAVSQAKAADDEITVATGGQVQVRASSGSLLPGDLLISDKTAGQATVAPADPRVGSILGKATSKRDTASNLVWALLMLQ